MGVRTGLKKAFGRIFWATRSRISAAVGYASNSLSSISVSSPEHAESVSNQEEGSLEAKKSELELVEGLKGL
jgi:hypothetical protein